MSDFTDKMHQIIFRLRPRPHWGAYSTPQTSYLDLRGLLLRGGGKGGSREVPSTFSCESTPIPDRETKDLVQTITGFIEKETGW